MIDYLKQTLTAQFEAALCMLNQCIAACPPEHWDAKIGNGPFRWVVYHTLFFTDLYLSPSNETFEFRELHHRVGDEREPQPCLGLEQADALEYVAVCREKALTAVAAETPESLAGPSGFSWYPISRGEFHINNIRHIQHHTGQLSAYLRKVNDELADRKALRWIGSGWH
jgi:hypothetical protein